MHHELLSRRNDILLYFPNASMSSVFSDGAINNTKLILLADHRAETNTSRQYYY